MVGDLLEAIALAKEIRGFLHVEGDLFDVVLLQGDTLLLSLAMDANNSCRDSDGNSSGTLDPKPTTTINVHCF